MNGSEFISLAGTLAASATPNAEARYRTAVSRAYYGAYHVAIEVLEELGALVRANHLGHRDTINKLRSTDVEEAMRAARIIEDLHTARIVADYRLKNRRFEKAAHALIAVEDAHDAVDALQACLAEPVKSELIARFKNG